MSRSGYSDDCDNPAALLWPSVVNRAIKGKRGQKFLQELAAEMDAMPKKELIAHDLVTEEGACCTVGVIYKARGIDPSKVDVYEPREVGKQVGISMAMTAEIEYWNDEGGREDETPSQRWLRMRAWVAKQLGEELRT